MKLLRAAALVLAAALCAWLLERVRPLRPAAPEASAAPGLPPEVARPLAFGFRTAVADIWYLEAIQLFGDRSWWALSDEGRARRGRDIYHLLDHVTELDPAFNYAYIFGGLAVPVPRGDGTHANVEQTLLLLEKGVRRGGPDWRIPFHLGYCYAEYKLDFAAAAGAMAEAARRPGRPDYVPLLAMRLSAEGGSVETGITLARAMLAQAPDAERRAEYEQRLRQLELERACLQVESAANRFREQSGRWPPDVAALVAAGHLDAAPEDPQGGRIEIDPETGLARSTAAERLRLGPKARAEMKRRMEEQSRARQARLQAEAK